MTPHRETLLELSRQKWHWMTERNIDALAPLFHDDAVFVHMGATLTRQRELDVIASGELQYKHVTIHESSIPVLNAATAILLNRLDLVAVVDGNQVTNPFVVTEVYLREAETWTLATMAFTGLLTA